MSKQGGETRSTCCAQQCCDMLSSNVTIVWPELANAGPTMLGYVVSICCDRLTGASNLSQQDTTCRNTSQQGGETRATCCAQRTMLRNVALACCDYLTEALLVMFRALKPRPNDRSISAQHVSTLLAQHFVTS